MATPARTQLEQIEGKGLTVVGRGDEERDAPDLAAVPDLSGFRRVSASCSSHWRAWPPFAVASPLRSTMRCMSSSMSSGPATSSSPLRIKYLADCLLAKSDFPAIFEHGDKDNYHVFQPCLPWWLRPKRSGSRLPRTTPALADLSQLAIESVQEALARSLSVRRSSTGSGRRPGQSWTAKPIRWHRPCCAVLDQGCQPGGGRGSAPSARGQQPLSLSRWLLLRASCTKSGNQVARLAGAKPSVPPQWTSAHPGAGHRSSGQLRSESSTALPHLWTSVPLVSRRSPAAGASAPQLR